MKFSFRSTPMLLLAALLALPGIGSEIGPGATGGGTGVWILPCCPKPVSATATSSLTGPPGASFAVPSLANSLTLTADSTLGEFTAVIVDEVSASPLPLSVSGRDVQIDREILQGLLTSGTLSAYVVITDANQLGYVLKLSIDAATNSATLTVR